MNKNNKDIYFTCKTIPISSYKADGITLISLVITIIILLILAGISLNTLFGANGIFKAAEEAAYKTRMSKYKEEVDLYVTNKEIESYGEMKDKIHSGDPLKEVIKFHESIGDKIDITEEEVNIPIKEIIQDIEERDEKYIVVYHGETYYVKSDKNKNAEQEAKWCLDVGIKILELKRPSEVENPKGDYVFVDEVYMCTPKIETGFNKYTTRYANPTDKGSITPGKWIIEEPDKNWYSYKKRNWANLIVEYHGAETHFVWIPRYCYKLEPNTQKTDVKLIATDNHYKDPYTEEKTTWTELEKQGYEIPEAFTFNGKELPGYWAMKYNVGETTSPTVISYNFAVRKNKITINNIKTNIPKENQITKYTIALNGQIQIEITNKSEIEEITSKTFELEGIQVGTNIINITGLNDKDEIVGSYTDIYEKTGINEPDLSEFKTIADTTFYVTYDDEGNETSNRPITMEEPEDWYEYGEKKWANIVVRNNGGEIYYTWIPRYEYQIDSQNQKSIVKFIYGTETKTKQGYEIPEAFTFDGKELKGYWATKYNIGEIDTALFSTEITTTGNTATTTGITGQGVSSGQVYNYYINGEYKGQTTTASDTFIFDELKQNKEYTILIEIRRSKALVGTIIKQVETSNPNEPNLIGFNPECTYYVTYDNNGNETIGEKIKKDGSNMPKNWYDYGRSRWANIVVKGKKADGSETATYFTWIPRYQFKLNQQTQRSEVKFIEGTGGATQGDYQVPDAFTFDGKALTGYWAMKYNIGDQ